MKLYDSFTSTDMIGLEDFLLKHLSSMRSDLLHPYIGVKISDYISTVNYVKENMSDAIVCKDRKDLFSKIMPVVTGGGLFLECGVKSGGTLREIESRVMNVFGKDQVIYGFDSFLGLPDDWAGTKQQKGKLSTKIRPNFSKRIIIKEGWFDQVLPDFAVEHKDSFVSFLHVDCDIYSSTCDIFNALFNLLVAGSIIVFDEYFNYPFWRNHEYKAFQEFIQRKKLSYEYLFYAHTQVGVRLIS